MPYKFYNGVKCARCGGMIVFGPDGNRSLKTLKQTDVLSTPSSNSGNMHTKNITTGEIPKRMKRDAEKIEEIPSSEYNKRCRSNNDITSHGQLDGYDYYNTYDEESPNYKPRSQRRTNSDLSVQRGLVQLFSQQQQHSHHDIEQGQHAQPKVSSTSTPTDAKRSPQQPINENTSKTLPPLGKIGLLSMISPPLPSGNHSPRGLVIAIDGTDNTTVQTMTDYLQNYLQREGMCNTRTFKGPKPYAYIQPKQTNSNSHTITSEKKISQRGTNETECFKLVTKWHEVSNEITKFITNPNTSSTTNSTEYYPLSPLSSTTSSPKSTTSSTTNPNPTDPTIIPIAIFPNYQLTMTELWTPTIPITNNYTYLDNWKWVACLWRGCIGPDITIYIHECDHEFMENNNPVEVHLDHNDHQDQVSTIIVRYFRMGYFDNGIEEKILKRVAFELVDYLIR